MLRFFKKLGGLFNFTATKTNLLENRISELHSALLSNNHVNAMGIQFKTDGMGNNLKRSIINLLNDGITTQENIQSTKIVLKAVYKHFIENETLGTVYDIIDTVRIYTNKHDVHDNLRGIRNLGVNTLISEASERYENAGEDVDKLSYALKLYDVAFMHITSGYTERNLINNIRLEIIKKLYEIGKNGLALQGLDKIYDSERRNNSSYIYEENKVEPLFKTLINDASLNTTVSFTDDKYPSWMRRIAFDKGVELVKCIELNNENRENVFYRSIDLYKNALSSTDKLMMTSILLENIVHKNFDDNSTKNMYAIHAIHAAIIRGYSHDDIILFECALVDDCLGTYHDNNILFKNKNSVTNMVKEICDNLKNDDLKEKVLRVWSDIISHSTFSPEIEMNVGELHPVIDALSDFIKDTDSTEMFKKGLEIEWKDRETRYNSFSCNYAVSRNVLTRETEIDVNDNEHYQKFVTAYLYDFAYAYYFEDMDENDHLTNEELINATELIAQDQELHEAVRVKAINDWFKFLNNIGNEVDIRNYCADKIRDLTGNPNATEFRAKILEFYDKNWGNEFPLNYGVMSSQEFVKIWSPQP